MPRNRLPDVLVSSAWLNENLGAPDLRVVECTTFLEYTEPGADVPYDPRPGRAEYEAAHIEGAVFADLVADLSRPDATTHFMLPKPAAFAQSMGRLGIGDGMRVVVYSRFPPMWATRLWWMLRVMGFDDAAVLDGGFERWQAEGRPVGHGTVSPTPATFTPRPRPELMVDRAFVLERLDDPSTLLVNTLSERDFLGDEPSRYGRPGRIPGSASAPWLALIDEESGRFIALDDAKRQLEAVGTADAGQIVCYCGGGISATMALLQLHRLGHDNLACYDASMSEWAKDESLPIERG